MAADEEKTTDPQETAEQSAQADGIADKSQGDDLPPVQAEIEDLGALRRRLKITVPKERIEAKRDESIKHLSDTAQVPGFRIGRAPRRLIEKRFGPELKDDLKVAMITQGYTQALEQTKLKALGEPEMTPEKIAAIELPESGPLTFELDVEVQPEFELPELENIPVTRPLIEVTDKDVDAALERWRANFTTLETVDEPAKADDTLVADLTFAPEGGEIVERLSAQVPVRPQAIEGVPMENLGEVLTGATAGQTITLETDIPPGHPNEELSGKKATFTFAVKQVRRTRLPEVDEQFAARFGFDNVAGLRDWLRERLRAESSQQQQRQMREQVYDYLLDRVQLELPEGVLSRMKDRAVLRRANELMMRGVPQETLEKHTDQLSVQAGEEAARELKTLFILKRVAEQLKVEVGEQDVNALVAQMAAQYNRRPDSLRAELERRDSLSQLYLQIQEQKAIDQLLEKAKIEDAKPEPKKPPEPEPAPEKQTAKKKPARKPAEKQTTPKKAGEKKAAEKKTPTKKAATRKKKTKT